MRRNTHPPWAPLPVQGQACECGARLFVQEGIYDQFVKKSIELAKQRKVGGTQFLWLVSHSCRGQPSCLPAHALLPFCPAAPITN